MRPWVVGVVFAVSAFASRAGAQPVAAPPSVPDDEVSTWSDPPLATTGIVLTSIGGGLALAGGVLAVVPPSSSCERSSDVVMCTDGPENVIGHIGLVTGGVLVLAGVPMIVVGAWDDGDSAVGTSGEVRVGPGRADLAIRF